MTTDLEMLRRRVVSLSAVACAAFLAPGGSGVAKRTCWSSQDFPPVGDLPVEAGLQPLRWGAFRFGAK